MRRPAPGRGGTARWLNLSASVLCVWLLAGCGGAQLPQLEPPRVAIVELELSQGTAAVRFDNPVAAPMPATRAEFTIAVEDELLGRFSPQLELTIPPLGSELVQLAVDPSTPGARRLRDAGRQSSRFTIDGSLILQDESPLEITESGWLSPNPGKPGSYR